MPVHVEEMTTEVEAYEGELPLSPAQLEKLVELVLKRMDERRRERERIDGTTKIRRGSTPGW